jgi:alpha-glucan,water dikinase
LGEVTDQIALVLQEKGEMLGKEFGLPYTSYKIFSEEITRGTLFFSLSMILKKIDPRIRESAHLGNWLVISQGRSHGSRGYIEHVRYLKDVMHKTYSRRTVLLCDKIDGEEEVPANVQAIILIDGTDYPDVLAHVSVRARNLKVLFTVCFEESINQELLGLVGKHTFFAIEGNKLRF